VYIFDEEGRKPNDVEPDNIVTFDEKTLNSKSVYAKSNMGHSYNLWVPFDSAGPDGLAKKVSLIVRYEPADKSSFVVGKQATVYLPGKSDPQSQDWQISKETIILDQISTRTALGNPASPLTTQAITIR
jgi:hypothetical protein